jgi:hypothetical protein
MEQRPGFDQGHDLLLLLMIPSDRCLENTKVSTVGDEGVVILSIIKPFSQYIIIIMTKLG